MGFLEEMLKNREDIVLKLIELAEGKETQTRVNLDGIEFKLGKTSIKLSGSVDIAVIPPKAKKKSRFRR